MEGSSTCSICKFPLAAGAPAPGAPGTWLPGFENPYGPPALADMEGRGRVHAGCAQLVQRPGKSNVVQRFAGKARASAADDLVVRALAGESPVVLVSIGDGLYSASSADQALLRTALESLARVAPGSPVSPLREFLAVYAVPAGTQDGEVRDALAGPGHRIVYAPGTEGDGEVAVLGPLAPQDIAATEVAWRPLVHRILPGTWKLLHAARSLFLGKGTLCVGARVNPAPYVVVGESLYRSTGAGRVAEWHKIGPVTSSQDVAQLLPGYELVGCTRAVI